MTLYFAILLKLRADLKEQKDKMFSNVHHHGRRRKDRPSLSVAFRLGIKNVVCLPYSQDKHIPIPRGKQRGMLAEKD